MLLFLWSLSFLFNFAISKICWRLCDESDKTQNFIQSLDISGCHRRSSYPEYEDFWCEGETGPPCTGLTGDTLSIEIELKNPGFTNLTQSATYLATSFLSFPWVGMDTNGCNYLDGGHGCMDPKPRKSSYSMPVRLENYYPPGKYDIRYQLYEAQEEVACALFTLRIV